MTSAEDLRRELQRAVNSGEIQPKGQTWTTKQVREQFEVERFLAPFVVVVRRADSVVGTLVFHPSPEGGGEPWNA